jgi:hypothetical protein
MAPTTREPIADGTPAPTIDKSCKPQPCDNDCGFGTTDATDTCQGCQCVCYDGATLTADNVCVVNRPGAAISTDCETYEITFRVCDDASEYIHYLTTPTRTTCRTLARESCDETCAKNRCTTESSKSGTFVEGKTGDTWENAYECYWELE